MPITTFQTILSSDKLQSGFRAKINADIALLITDIVDNGDGTCTVELQGGTNIQISLTDSFFIKQEVIDLIAAVDPAVWGGITGDVEDQTDVVGNLGVIDPIDDILFSANFGVAAADGDNPFGAFAASGYASFSVPSVTGFQLLIKEATATDIKLRSYSGGVWHSWTDIGVGITVTGTTDASGNFDASATGTARLISVYEGDILIRPEFNKSTKLLSAMNPLTAITAYFI